MIFDYLMYETCVRTDHKFHKVLLLSEGKGKELSWKYLLEKALFQKVYSFLARSTNQGNYVAALNAEIQLQAVIVLSDKISQCNSKAM